MPGIWIFSEDNTLATELISAGLSLKGTMNQPVAVITLDASQKDALLSTGVDKVVVASNGGNWTESYADGLADLFAKEDASAILIGATMRGKDIAAKIAAKLKAGLVTDAQSIAFVDGKIETTRMMYGGLALCTEAVSLPAMVTIPAHLFEAAAAIGATGEAVSAEIASDSKVAISDVCPIVRQGVDITTAARIVSVGRGLGKQEDLGLAEDLAKAMGAEIACSRGIAEDYHWLPIERYVGISGQKVAPEVYLSVGISGQVQHVAGMRDSKIIVAIDNNEKAPIFAAADYGIVGDLYEVLPLLTAALKK